MLSRRGLVLVEFQLGRTFRAQGHDVNFQELGRFPTGESIEEAPLEDKGGVIFKGAGRSHSNI